MAYYPIFYADTAAVNGIQAYMQLWGLAIIHTLPCAGMGADIAFNRGLGGNMRIQLGRRDRSMAQKLLHSTDIGPALDKMCSTRMPERMRVDFFSNMGTLCSRLDYFPHRLA